MKKHIQPVDSKAKRLAAATARNLKEKKQKQLATIKAATEARLSLISRSALQADKLKHKLEIIQIERKGLPVFKCKLVALPVTEKGTANPAPAKTIIKRRRLSSPLKENSTNQ